MKILLLTSVDPNGPQQGDRLRVRHLWQAMRRLEPQADMVVLNHDPRLGRTCPPIWPPYLWQSGWVWEGDAYDAVVAFQLRMAPLALTIPARRRLLDLTDSLGWYRQRLPLNRQTWLKHLMLIGIGPAEGHWAQRFQTVWVSAEPDRQWLGRQGLHARLVPNGVKEKRWLSPGNPKRLLTVGNFSYLPNRLGYQEFLRNVWPRLLQAGYQLTVVGHMSQSLPSAQGVSRLGFQEDLAAYYADCGVALSPVWTGSGSQNKILEAMGYARPVVCRREGAVGLSAAQQAACLMVGPSADEWSAALRTLADPDQYDQYQRRGFEAVKPWDEIFQTALAAWLRAQQA